MKKTRLWTTGLLAALFISAYARAGYVPETISYEGTVLDEFGQPGSGTRSLLFSLVDTNGVTRWQEGLADVPLNQQGAFQVLLGKNIPLPAIEPSWRINVELKNGSSSWKEVTPTQAMTTVFFALQADDARRVPNDLAVRQDLRVTGELKTEGLVSASRLNAEDIRAGDITITNRQLTVSDLSSTTNSPISISGELELTQGLTLKGSVSMMMVMDYNSSTSYGLSGRYYLLAIPINSMNLSCIKVSVAASGALRTYHSNMPGGIYFLPLDMSRGDSIHFYDRFGEETPFYGLFRTIKLIQMHQ